MGWSEHARALRARLEARVEAGEEVISPLQPEVLRGGAWWPEGAAWPEVLRAGIIEPRRGYRFRPENVALAEVLGEVGAGERVVDLGAGTGSLLVLASVMLGAKRAVGVERQGAQAARLRKTLDAWQGFGVCGEVVEGDLRDAAVLERVREALGGAADVVVTNPPFFPPGWGRPSAEETTQQSTHALFGGARDFLCAARRLVTDDGWVAVVYDAGRFAEVCVAAEAARLNLTHIRWIADGRPNRQRSPFRIWALCRPEGARVQGARVRQIGPPHASESNSTDAPGSAHNPEETG